MLSISLVCFSGCSGNSERKDCFDWNYEHTKIKGYSEYGKTRGEIVIPAECQGFSGKMNDCVAYKISFESDDLDFGSAFCESEHLENFEIPSGITSLTPGAFRKCTSLKSIVIPSGVTEIPNVTFFGDFALQSVAFEGDITSLGSMCFYRCESLNSINIPDSLTTIEDSAFFGCIALDSINLPEGLTTIGNKALGQCTALTSISLPSTLKTVGEYVIFDSEIATIYVPSDMELTEWDPTSFSNAIYVTVYVTEGSWADQHFEEVFGHATKAYN